MANGPNIFQMLIVFIIQLFHDDRITGAQRTQLPYGSVDCQLLLLWKIVHEVRKECAYKMYTNVKQSHESQSRQQKTIRRIPYAGAKRFLAVTQVNWRIIGNLGFKFRSKFTAHCRRGEGSSQQQHLALC